MSDDVRTSGNEASNEHPHASKKMLAKDHLVKARSELRKVGEALEDLDVPYDDTVECPDCEKQAGITQPGVGGVIGYCENCDNPMERVEDE